MNQNNIAIEVSALSFRVQQVTILEGINLSIPRGAVVGLVGRNGAGKTSLLKCMAGLATPSKGAAYLLGFDSANLPDSVLERLGYVAQTADLFEWMEVSQMLQTIGQAYPGWSQERCLKLAARLDLPMGSMIKNLSGGDQQKLALVLALAHDPDVLLLDEPVSGLDPITRSEFMRSLFADRTEGNDQAEETGARTVIISSHLLTDLQRVVSHVAFIRDGRLQLFDTWDAMLEHFRLVRSPQADIPSNAIVCRNAVNGHCVVDTRMAAQYAGQGRTLSLEELFAELNA